MNARAEILQSQLASIGDGIAGACAVLARDPRPDACEMLAIRLGGAQRHVLTLADELQRKENRIAAPVKARLSDLRGVYVMGRDKSVPLEDAMVLEPVEVLSIADRGQLNFYSEKWGELKIPGFLDGCLLRLDKAIVANAGVSDLLRRNETHRDLSESCAGVRYEALDAPSVHSLQIAQEILIQEMENALEDIEVYFRERTKGSVDMSERSDEYVDLCDEVSAKLAQAESLSAIMFADSGETFRNLSDQIQDETCWLLHSVLSEARAAYSKASRLEYEMKQAGKANAEKKKSRRGVTTATA